MSDNLSPKGQVPPRIAVGGSGRAHLPKGRHWVRELLSRVAAYEAGRISQQAVFSVFARLNHHVAGADSNVSQRCIVACRLQAGGGGHEFFNGVQKEDLSSPVWMPIISHGRDITATARVLFPFDRISKELDDVDTLNKELAKLPEGPDDNLPVFFRRVDKR